MSRHIKQRKISTPELIAQINPKNKQLISEWINYLRSVQRSDGTIKSYNEDLTFIMCWNILYNDNKFFIDWTKRNVISLQTWCVNFGNSPARIRRLKAVLSSLSNYIENMWDEDYPNFRNIIKKVENPVATPVLKKTVFSDEDIDTLLDILTEKGYYDRACAVALARWSGRRKAELLRFRVSDFAEDKIVCNGALYKSAPIKTKGRGIYGKQLECFTLGKYFKPYLDRWMDYRFSHGIIGEMLFPSPIRRGESISESTLTTWAEDFTKLINKDFYWHSLRHMTVTSFKKAGMPDSVIKSYIGWDSLDMVGLYDDTETSEQLGLFFNGDGIVKRDAFTLASL